MATLIRTTLVKSVGHAPVCRVTALAVVPTRGICGREMRQAMPPTTYKKPAPFDHEFKDYTWLRSLFDRTSHRIDENSKVILVEGPPAVGKTEFAKQLAEELDMRHFPEATMDDHYIRPNGFDLRKFDPEIPEDARTFDHKDFCKNPTHRLAANFQLMMYSARYSQYIDALAHLLNSGQGVVLERSPFSDYVFMEAMFQHNFLSKGARSVYYDIRANTIGELLRPHLVLYLDIPVQTVQQRIKERNLPHEKDSKALTPDFLKTVEHMYKHKYLREIGSHAELLVYDWTGKGEVEVVVEDIERLNFEKYTERVEPKMKDWRFPREIEWADARMLFTNGKHYLMNLFNVARADVPELVTSADDAYARDMVIQNHPQFQWLDGYNKEAGDTGLLTKNTHPKNIEFI